MNHQVDLMPETSRRRLGQRRIVQRWVALYSTTIVAIAVGASLLSVVERNQRREVEGLSIRVDFDAEQREQARRLRARIASYQDEIDRYRKLAWPVDFSDVIAVVGELSPDSVSLDSLSIIPQERRVRAPRRGDKRDKESEERISRKLIIEMTGIAPDDFHMANFVGGLEEHPLFERIAVDYARDMTFRGVAARQFGVTCEIDFNHLYTFASAATDGEAGP